MSEPTRGPIPGPYVAHNGWSGDGPIPDYPDWCEINQANRTEYMSVTGHMGIATAHLLAASWEMREAIAEHLDDLDNGRPINTVKLYRALASARGEGR